MPSNGSGAAAAGTPEVASDAAVSDGDAAQE
jgi:hypothetical protein